MKQNDIFRLALQAGFKEGDLSLFPSLLTKFADLVAAELRRLHALDQELLEFVEEVRRTGDTRLASMAIAVISKATGELK